MNNVENLNLPAYVKVESKLGTLGDLEGKTVLLREIDYDVPTFLHYGICYDSHKDKVHKIARETFLFQLF